MRYSLPAALCLAAAATTAATAVAQPRLVTDPQICAMGPDEYKGEVGMVLTDTSMEVIEFYCTWAEPLTFDWSGDEMQTRIGYCSEPGFVTPQVWTFQYGSQEPGVVRVWWQDASEPTLFTACD